MANRIRPTRASVAYRNDIDFAPQQGQPEERLRVVHPRPNRRRALRFQHLACLGLVIMIAGTILYSQMELTKLTREASLKEGQLEDLESEYISLKAKQDSAVSLSYVEEYAQNKLGMVKMDSNQVEYIEINNPDRIEAATEARGIGGIVSSFARSFGAVLEYLG